MDNLGDCWCNLLKILCLFSHSISAMISLVQADFVNFHKYSIAIDDESNSTLKRQLKCSR